MIKRAFGEPSSHLLKGSVVFLQLLLVPFTVNFAFVLTGFQTHSNPSH
jgi:hypothetical protein